VIAGWARIPTGGVGKRADATIMPSDFANRPRQAAPARDPPSMVANQALLALIARQDGLITASQAARCGLTERSLQRRAREQGWRRVTPRVFLAAGHRFTDRARVRAAGLWAGNRGVVSGPAAAWWHGMLPVLPARIEVTVPRHLGLRGCPGIRVRRRDLPAANRGISDLTNRPAHVVLEIRSALLAAASA
jgi:hypothetical protein